MTFNQTNDNAGNVNNSEQADFIYLVGSREDHFIVDVVFRADQLEDAKQHCAKNYNTKYEWQVLKVKFGDWHFGWKPVYSSWRDAPQPMVS